MTLHFNWVFDLSLWWRPVDHQIIFMNTSLIVHPNWSMNNILCECFIKFNLLLCFALFVHTFVLLFFARPFLTHVFFKFITHPLMFQAALIVLCNFYVYHPTCLFSKCCAFSFSFPFSSFYFHYCQDVRFYILRDTALCQELKLIWDV